MAGTFEYSNFSLVVPEEPGVPNVLALLPPCARTCSLAQLELFRCLGTDWECICYQNAKDDLFMHFNYCFDGSCPIQDVYAGNRVLYGSCGIEVPPSSGQLLVVSAVLGSIAVLALLLRFMSRMRVFGIRWGIDDWISLLVLVSAPDKLIAICLMRMITQPLAILFIILQFVLVHYGLGKDIWTLDNKTIIEVGKYFLIDELAYLTLTIATKISILCFYLRIFHSRNVRIAIFGLIGLLVATLIGFFFSFLFQCRPVQDAWELYGSTDPKVVAHCDVDAWAVIMAFGFCNVVLDLVIMAFPVPILVKLKMGKRKKARVIALSSVGVW
ncbi:hypothetical protein EJ05DRAFT_497078 [Pseudovirgaria hyperparasitica]|uniref:Uncharacterized protein n=1 Tax=Pseudovirgaria hyperparasitica TaxID=470096 RepID=A0A6A6WJV3_9PEZI|nr:uncharacterized protein EJ05DRAFT_497078 [Pseudovirgaria hyperparasitica]KAF2762217.1 hypothetical protein EJ05DRAFT_497078 [Pseudovirgaria hyperparasitica]